MNSRPCQILPFAVTCRVLAAILLAGFATTGASAQTGNVTPSLGSERPANLPQLGTDENSFPGTWIRDFRGPDASIGESRFSERAKGPYFLPTLLPVLGAPPPANQAPLAANYPREFAGEAFFMAYGNLAAHNELSAKRVERIARYRTARLALLTELRAQLNRGPDASALAGLASNQTPRLLELEAEAEKIRHDLTHGKLYKNTADDIGELMTTDEAPAHRADLTSVPVLLSAAHFQDGFSSDQRRLLEEIALETQLIIEPEPEATNPAPVFFWPAGVRISSPMGLPPEVAARFDEFQRRKAALKDELRTALDRETARRFNPDRTEARARLAAAEAPRFAELDALADQLRPALAAQANALAALPTDLGRQVAAIVERKAALQRELYARFIEFRRELPAEHFELIRQGEGLAIATSLTTAAARTASPCSPASANSTWIFPSVSRPSPPRATACAPTSPATRQRRPGRNPA